MPYGRNFYPGFGFSGYYGGYGWGRGNPYPYCRNFPWLPRGWWAYGNYSPYAASYPNASGYGNYSPYATGYPYTATSPWNWGAQAPGQEMDYLRQQAEMIRTELQNIENRIKDLESEAEK